MTPATERTLKTLAFVWIAGGLSGAFLGWLLVPAAFSVEYLTPIVIAGPFVGLVVGGALTRRNATQRTS